MTALLIALIVAGALLVLCGVFLRQVWRVGIRPLYRHPEAQEPSKLSWLIRSTVMILAGVVVMVTGIGLLVDAADELPAASENSAPSCADLVDDVGSPSTRAEVDGTVQEAAGSAGYDVERIESSSDSTAELPGGDETITVDVTTWTVLDGSDIVAKFTWTSSESVPGRFGAADCA